MKRSSSDTEQSPKQDGRRRRSTRGSLRRYQEIDHVRVEETFSLREPAFRGGKKVGQACYVTATINNRRYYGTLVDQDALKTASMLYFRDAAGGLEVNKRMKIMKQRQKGKQQPESKEGGSKLTAVSSRVAVSKNSNAIPSEVQSSEGVVSTTVAPRQVQKFRYVEGDVDANNSGFRVLLATFVDIDAAAEDDEDQRNAIKAACHSGGDFVGDYYYQYEVRGSYLESEEHVPSGTETRGLRMTMGFNAFLQNALLPDWFPLSNLELGQQVLDTLGMKKDNNGMLVWDERKHVSEVFEQTTNELIPMEPRSTYRVVVVGGGIAGLCCCLEIFQACERDGLDVEVTLVEGRSRLGGRLWTDKETFRTGESQTPFPVDLGASWIHGIDSNPLAAMALEANVDFVRASEEVTMLRDGGAIVDQDKDEQAGVLFDKLLDLAVETSWRAVDGTVEDSGGRTAVRWYASGFIPTEKCTDGNMGAGVESVLPPKIPAGRHRDSSDTSVDEAIGKVISSGRLAEVASLSEEERRMLQWNIKNIEYALGANIADLSMKFWDIDERHAFEGDHVMLKQGYSCIVDHIHKKLKQYGDRFSCLLSSPVRTIEYARKSMCNPYFCPNERHKRFVELSDTCRVVFENSQASIPCDFVVCAVPLGVLKESIKENDNISCSALAFDPPLPFSKRDAIAQVGFGLLDKVYLQFPRAFWRTWDVLKEGQTSFGNASSCNPHHYMFIDVGLSMMESRENSPPILMTLISGKEAVMSECLGEEELVAQVVRTLRILFQGRDIPNPISHKVTRWGRDRFSRGSYSFLGPGTTDQDFRLLQTPINGNGDSVILDSSETMRLFFAGEHTTALHPSMAHGAMLSGYRAAKEVVDSMAVSFAEDIDKTIPLALFRHVNPKGSLTCVLCHSSGSRVREGTLLAFKRGSRELLVHNNCAENSPEVGVKDGVWTNVIKACNRGKTMECSLCGQVGATIGCSVGICHRSYHFSCAEDTGWRFDDDGKEFSCDQHRPTVDSTRKISLEYWLMKSEGGPLTCALCDISSERDAGELVAFQKGGRRVVVHECCARYTSTIKITENTSSRFEKDFENPFEALESARTCERCSRDGATIECVEPTCNLCYHFHCARSLDWDCASSKKFHCLLHRRAGSLIFHESEKYSEGFQHALFSLSGSGSSKNLPVNHSYRVGIENIGAVETNSLFGGLRRSVVHPDYFGTEKIGSFDADTNEIRLVNITRQSQKSAWNLALEAAIDPVSGVRLLSVANKESGTIDGLSAGDVIWSINGIRVGTSALDTVEKALKILAQELEIFLEVCESPIHDDAWGA